MSKELQCWSCKAVFTLSEHADCDGCCWKCGVEIDLNEIDIPATPQPPALGGEPVAWTYMHEGPESYSEPNPCLVWASESIDVMRQGLKTGDHVHYVPRPDLYDWQPLFYGHEFAPLQAEIARLRNTLPNSTVELSDARSEIGQLKARCDELEALAKKQNEALRLIVVEHKPTVTDLRNMAKRAFNESNAALSKPAGSEKV